MAMRLNLIITEHADLALHAYLESLPLRERSRALKQLAFAGLAIMSQGVAVAAAPVARSPAQKARRPARVEIPEQPVLSPAPLANAAEPGHSNVKASLSRLEEAVPALTSIPEPTAESARVKVLSEAALAAAVGGQVQASQERVLESKPVADSAAEMEAGVRTLGRSQRSEAEVREAFTQVNGMPGSGTSDGQVAKQNPAVPVSSPSPAPGGYSLAGLELDDVALDF